MIGNASSPDSCPHASFENDLRKRDLGTWKACYHDAVLSGNGQVLVIGSSAVQNDNYDDAYNMIITTYKWNANATIGDWDLMENKGGSLPQATTWQKNALPYQMMVLYLQYAPSLALLCTPGVWIGQVGFHEKLSLILTIYQQVWPGE
jgi:hypothetical protein